MQTCSTSAQSNHVMTWKRRFWSPDMKTSISSSSCASSVPFLLVPSVFLQCKIDLKVNPTDQKSSIPPSDSD